MKFKAYSLIIIALVFLSFLLYNNEFRSVNNQQRKKELGSVNNQQQNKELGSANNQQQESDFPFVKITPINSFYNNDYYGKILNYRINSNVVEGNKKYIVDYNVEYPQLYNIKNLSVLQEVNNQLKMMLFKDNYNETLNDFSSIINKKNEGVRSAKGTCKIYLFDDDYISLGYNCLFYTGWKPITVNRLLTINLTTGKSVNLKDFVNLDSIIINIKDLKFDIVEGSYTDGFGTGKEAERISSFIEEFQESIKGNTTEFSMDKSNLYLNFPYQDSLNGYMVLRFNLIDLKQ